MFNRITNAFQWPHTALWSKMAMHVYGCTSPAPGTADRHRKLTHAYMYACEKHRNNFSAEKFVMYTHTEKSIVLGDLELSQHWLITSQTRFNRVSRLHHQIHGCIRIYGDFSVNVCMPQTPLSLNGKVERKGNGKRRGRQRRRILDVKLKNLKLILWCRVFHVPCCPSYAQHNLSRDLDRDNESVVASVCVVVLVDAEMRRRGEMVTVREIGLGSRGAWVWETKMGRERKGMFS